jgi:Tannase and feruloyl esterase
LIIYQGWADEVIPPFGTVAYYKAVVDTAGGYQASQTFSRLYMVPAQYHCLAGGDPALAGPNLLTPLIDWVEHGTAPGSLSFSTATIKTSQNETTSGGVDDGGATRSPGASTFRLEWPERQLRLGRLVRIKRARLSPARSICCVTVLELARSPIVLNAPVHRLGDRYDLSCRLDRLLQTRIDTKIAATITRVTSTGSPLPPEMSPVIRNSPRGLLGLANDIPAVPQFDAGMASAPRTSRRRVDLDPVEVDPWQFDWPRANRAMRDQPGDIAQERRQDAFVRGVDLFDRPPSPCRVDFVLQRLPSCSRWLEPIRAPREEGFHRIQRLTPKSPLTPAGGNRIAQLCGVDDQSGLFTELARCGFAECFARIDPSAGSDPERRLGVTWIFDQKKQHAVGPVDDDYARRGRVKRRGHLPIVTDGESPRTAAASGTLDLRDSLGLTRFDRHGCRHTYIGGGVPG